MWSIWKARNAQRHGEVPAGLISSVRCAHDIAFDLCQICSYRSQKPRSGQKSWSPPDSGVFKFNADGAFCPEDLTGASGVVARDDAGAFVVARTHWYPYMANALVADARAVRDGVNLALEWEAQKVVIECDSKNLVNP